MSAMLPELGLISLIAAVVLSLLSGALLFSGAALNDSRLMAAARPLAFALSALVLLSFACLTALFLLNDFSVSYVAQHSSTLLPTLYRIAAVWGGHEGSLLLWLLLLCLWTLAVALSSRALDPALLARVIAVMSWIAGSFGLFLLLTSSPFTRLDIPALEGRELNPMLQDPGLVIHPPLLYMGYVGFSVAFAMAIGGLMSGRIDAAWARWSRPWTTFAWVNLTLGIAIGSVWAYYELGWGGWWFWDPVENASFMPWLAGTALMHSLAATDKRGVFKSWTVLLAILTFSLSLLGTFLVRSGVLSSVHAFASDPSRGLFILVLTALVVGASLLLFALKAPALQSHARFEPLSRESLLLANNVLLCVATASVLLGTLYPLMVDALNLGKLSVGPPYFNAVFVPLMLPLLFVLGIGPVTRWKAHALAEITRRLGVVLAVSCLLAVLWVWSVGQMSALSVTGVALALWITLSALLDLASRLRKGQRPALGIWGMHLAHIGVAITVVGITLTSAYESERDVALAPGEHAMLAGYRFTLQSAGPLEGPNYLGEQAHIAVSRDGKAVATLKPEKRVYLSMPGMPMTEAAIHDGALSHVYVALADKIGDTAWGIRLYHKPFIGWIWYGALLMALGGLIAVADRRYRARKRKTQ
ncbi:heme lyase CcmF/NrfE family subunit [Craterilacuibacter sp. RT1T]|uniref:heme lyase CcmF/NrfE family subunit n=1 Tax=Craterilacuibacter sp. RT1T TaxID=2942211 RepID=UPI0020BEECE0|nr:heme lyase CcmF/NrfE family subunit [Craterilacuibacter sp. RT1T]MCL6263831.1 heme lyase CcmF/NrfE family subunit [Craterilacuibacter sp. RT1T]